MLLLQYDSVHLCYLSCMSCLIEFQSNKILKAFSNEWMMTHFIRFLCLPMEIHLEIGNISASLTKYLTVRGYQPLPYT